MKDLLTLRATEADMHKIAVLKGTRTLLEEAMDDVCYGVTTREAVSRVIELEAETMIRCPQCHGFTQQDFSTCPYCLFPLKHLCDSCGQERQPAWKICPYCDVRSSQEPSAESRTPTRPKTSDAASPAVRVGQVSPPSEPVSTPVPKKLRALVVDDDDSIKNMVLLVLLHFLLSIDIVMASNGVESGT